MPRPKREHPLKENIFLKWSSSWNRVQRWRQAIRLTDPTTKGFIQAQLSTTRLSAADLAQVQGGVKGESIADKHKDESPAELPTEAVSLNFGKIVPTYTPQKTDGTSGLETTGTDPTIAQKRPDGGGGGNVTAKWDLKKAKGA